MAILGFTIPPHAMANYDHGKEVNRCPNVGCGLLQVPDGRILRCPPNCTMRQTREAAAKQAKSASNFAPASKMAAE